MTTITELEFGLVANLTSTGTWVQLAKINGAVYAVPANGETKVRWLRAMNLGANTAAVQFAFSPNGTIADDEVATSSISLATGESLEDERGDSLPVTYAIWAKATGTTPNVTVRAFAFETVTV